MSKDLQNRLESSPQILAPKSDKTSSFCSFSLAVVHQDVSALSARGSNVCVDIYKNNMQLPLPVPHIYLSTVSIYLSIYHPISIYLSIYLSHFAPLYLQNLMISRIFDRIVQFLYFQMATHACDLLATLTLYFGPKINQVF